MIKYNGVSAYPYSYDYIKEQISQYNTNIANLINEISEIQKMELFNTTTRDKVISMLTEDLCSNYPD